MSDPLFISRYERLNKIEALLAHNDWTWYRLAKEMNTDRSVICRAFRDKRKTEPSLVVLKRLARAFGVSAGFFIDRRVKR